MAGMRNGRVYPGLVAFCDRHAATEDNVVTAKVATASDLAVLLTDQLRKVHRLSPDRPRGQQELLCAADVAEALGGIVGEAEAVMRERGLSPAFLFDIPIIISPDSAPGTWRLVTHDHCDVRLNEDEPLKSWVSHAECSVTAEGHLA